MLSLNFSISTHNIIDGDDDNDIPATNNFMELLKPLLLIVMQLILYYIKDLFNQY